MTQATLSHELVRQSISLARALSAAARNWALYPPEHPAAVASVTRLGEAIATSVAGAAFTFGVTPKTLLVAGYPLPKDHAVAEAARLLHDHDILQITFVGEPEINALHSLLALLARSVEELRAEGGPGKAWSKLTHTSVAIEQIDYERILEDRDVEHELGKGGDVWRSVVNSIVEGRSTFDSAQQQRLLEIAGNAFEIRELATAVSAPKCNVDDPHVVMQIMQTDEGVQETPILGRIAESFDDDKVAELLSSSYQASLEGAVGRREMFSTRDLPRELPEWVESLQQDNVRSLSVLLITDLLRIEEQEERAVEIASDMTALVEDLLMSGDFANSVLVLRELKRAREGKVAPAAARAALTQIADSPALRETATMLTDFDDGTLTLFMECCECAGPLTIRALHPALASETETSEYIRARDLVHRFGATGVPHIAPLADDSRWFVQRNAAALLGAIRSAEAVPVLQTLLRRSDPPVLRTAVAALSGIDDPAAARAVQTALRAASGANRDAVVAALVAEKNPRVVPMLAQILTESDPFGADHQTVIDTLHAVRQLADDRAVPAVVTVMRRKKLFAWKKARLVKEASVLALSAVASPRARSALADAASTGDWMLKRVVKQAQAAS
jgi:HEAT repeat protein